MCFMHFLKSLVISQFLLLYCRKKPFSHSQSNCSNIMTKLNNLCTSYFSHFSKGSIISLLHGACTKVTFLLFCMKTTGHCAQSASINPLVPILGASEIICFYRLLGYWEVFKETTRNIILPMYVCFDSVCNNENWTGNWLSLAFSRHFVNFSRSTMNARAKE